MDYTPITLHYFPICGRGEPIRLLLEDAGVPYTESNDVGAFKARKFDFAEYAFGQLPRLTVTPPGSGEPTHLVQQGAILRFLARVAGYEGVSGDALEVAKADMLQDACEDLNGEYVRMVYSPQHDALVEPFVKETVPRYLGQFEAFFAARAVKDGFLLSATTPSYAEFHLLYLIQALALFVPLPALLEPYPALAAWHARFEAREGVRKYLESGRVPKQKNGVPRGCEC
ncbi:glutathione S-transferase family protein [Rhodotorula paludigena]|uniref:glutathione S-transferase family protein n=1 Tax=Rhodotorula paludigena TaxID=86838 RepID=UPI003181763E